MYVWLKDKIKRFMFITIVDNVIGPSNSDPTKRRPWAVWKYRVETTDDFSYVPEDEGYSNDELDDMYRAAMNGF